MADTPYTVMAKWLKTTLPKMVASEVSKIEIPKPKDGLDGKHAVGIDDIKTHGADMLIKLSDGTEKRFKVGSGRSSTPFGGSSGGGGSMSAGTGIDINGSTISVKRTWTDYVTRWDAEPTLLGTSSSPVAGEVYEYVLGGVTRYRLVPTSYAPAEDSFYSSFSGGSCSGLLVSRIEP